MKLQLPATARLTQWGGNSLSSNELLQEVMIWQELLLGYDARRIVLEADSGLQWALLDLACLAADLVLVPLPTYLSSSQRDAVLAQLQPDLLISDSPEQQSGELLEEYAGLSLYRLPMHGNALVPAGTQKITFTSGSTGQPKGVCLSAEQQLDVALWLAARVQQISQGTPRHLCLLPLPTLLENIAGIYAPLLEGGEVVLAKDAERGFSGSRLTEPQKLLALISQVQPKSLILVPELLQFLLLACQSGWQAPTSLEFIAVGGAVVSPALLQAAAKAGLPVYQGYGLSECASVVALSVDPAEQAGASVGLPLAGRQVRIEDGELVVQTPFLGYLGEPGSASDEVRTGDLASWGPNGELLITGRKKNLLINSFGRNISPEWVETALTSTGAVMQAILLGDGQPACVALLFARPEVSDQQLAAVVDSVNAQLPDYARIARYSRLSQPFSVAEGSLTDNGRLRRQAIQQLYSQHIDQLYSGVRDELLSLSA
ncbi:AMP-binding protein [Rheinheimera marina]|uniref:AMP-binding protein n=1 Tax=Rheinheimera marina TaxID=1774958 RepID=A0ABV9JI93_9GAMM